MSSTGPTIPTLFIIFQLKQRFRLDLMNILFFFQHHRPLISHFVMTNQQHQIEHMSLLRMVRKYNYLE